VAERAGTIALQTHQRVAGVIENMSWLPCPHCNERIDVFGAGGGEQVAAGLTRALGADVPLLGTVPIDVRLREGGDTGMPLVIADPDAPAATTLAQIATRLGRRERGLLGTSLSLTPTGR
jgi:ATP-binding protein involved in chromosome partitioning